MNTKRKDPKQITFRKYRRGIYGSYGDRDIRSFQCKVDRELLEKFDTARKKYHMNRNEILEHFMEYYISATIVERNDLANKKLILNDEEVKKQFIRYEQEKRKKYLKPLVTNGITTDLEKGYSVDIIKIYTQGEND